MDERPDCSAILSVSQVCPGNGSVPIDPSLQRFRTTRLETKIDGLQSRVLLQFMGFAIAIVAATVGLTKLLAVAG